MQALHPIEAALAQEAAAHSRASAELNPFGEAEAIALGSACLVYAGAFSPVHGVYGLGLDGPAEDREWAEIERFFQRKERAPNYFVAPFTDQGIEERIRPTHQLAHTENIRGWILEEKGGALPEAYLSGPDHGEWSLAFARLRNPGAKEADLLSATKLHQKNTRFYLQAGAASYTFFHLGVAVVPYPAGASLLKLQKREAEAFRCKAFVVLDAGQSVDAAALASLPLLYERKIYEPVRS